MSSRERYERNSYVPSTILNQKPLNLSVKLFLNALYFQWVVSIVEHPDPLLR